MRLPDYFDSPEWQHHVSLQSAVLHVQDVAESAVGDFMPSLSSSLAGMLE